MYNPQIETFVKVADAGSFSKAAEQMYISPTAVIKQINLLENDLNLQLFIRTHRGLTLTRAGEALYKDAKYIISYSKEAVLRAKSNAADGRHCSHRRFTDDTGAIFIKNLGENPC